MTEHDEFAPYTVWWWDVDGGKHREKQTDSAQEAVECAVGLTRRPFAVLLARVIITDSGDFCAWEWKKGEGLVYPTKAMMEARR